MFVDSINVFDYRLSGVMLLLMQVENIVDIILKRTFCKTRPIIYFMFRQHQLLSYFHVFLSVFK